MRRLLAQGAASASPSRARASTSRVPAPRFASLSEVRANSMGNWREGAPSSWRTRVELRSIAGIRLTATSSASHSAGAAKGASTRTQRAASGAQAERQQEGAEESSLHGSSPFGTLPVLSSGWATTIAAAVAPATSTPAPTRPRAGDPHDRLGSGGGGAGAAAVTEGAGGAGGGAGGPPGRVLLIEEPADLGAHLRTGIERRVQLHRTRVGGDRLGDARRRRHGTSASERGGPGRAPRAAAGGPRARATRGGGASR